VEAAQVAARVGIGGINEKEVCRPELKSIADTGRLARRGKSENDV